MTKELQLADLNPSLFLELLRSTAQGEDVRVIIPGTGSVRILPEPMQMAPEAFQQLLAHPDVAGRLDQAVGDLAAGKGIPDEEMDDVFGHG